MRGSMRTSSKSVFVSYLLCFVAGGATIGVAAYALHLSQAATAETASAAVQHRGRPAGAAKIVAGQASRATPPGAAIAVQPLPVLISRADIGATADASKEEPQNLPASDGADLDEWASQEVWTPGRTDSYRTVCVRLCDGSYAPISFATTRDRFKADAARCKAGCGSPVRMFYSKAGAGDIEDMIDVHGASYVDLPNAFKFRTAYDEACTCRGMPWDEAELARHRELAKAAKAAQQQVAAAVPVAPMPYPVAVAIAEPVATPVIAEGMVTRSQSSSLAMTADLPALSEPNVTVPAEASRPALTHVPPAGPLVKPAAKAAVAAVRSVELPVRKPATAHTVKPAASKALASAAQRKKPSQAAKPVVVVASAHAVTGPGPSRGLLPDARGRERAQRTFKGQDYWRLTYWEPRN